MNFSHNSTPDTKRGVSSAVNSCHSFVFIDTKPNGSNIIRCSADKPAVFSVGRCTCFTDYIPLAERSRRTCTVFGYKLKHFVHNLGCSLAHSNSRLIRLKNNLFAFMVGYFSICHGAIVVSEISKCCIGSCKLSRCTAICRTAERQRRLCKVGDGFAVNLF